MTISVTGAGRYLRNGILPEATLVVPEKSIGALLTVTQVVNRLKQLQTTFAEAAKDAQKQAQHQKFLASVKQPQGIGIATPVKKDTRFKTKAEYDRIAREEQNEGGGGGRGGGTFNLLRNAGMGAGRFALRAAPWVAAAAGTLGVVNNVMSGENVSLWNAGTAGAGYGAIIGSMLLPGLGMIPGAAIGAAIGIGAAVVYNARDQIAAKWGEMTTIVSNASNKIVALASEKWDAIIKTTEGGFNYISNLISENYKKFTSSVAEYYDELSTWLSKQGKNLSDWLDDITKRLHSYMSTIDMKTLAADWLARFKKWLEDKFGGGISPPGTYAGNGPSGATNPGTNPAFPTGPAGVPTPGTGTGPGEVRPTYRPGILPEGAGGPGGDSISRSYGEKNAPTLPPGALAAPTTQTETTSSGGQGVGFVSPVTGIFDATPGSGYGAGRGVFGSRAHSGIDWRARTGSDAVSMTNGTVLYNGVAQGYGANIVIKGDDVIRRYAVHGQTADLQPGARVSQGQKIGIIGEGHLHYEEIPPTLNNQPNPVYKEMVDHPGQFVSTAFQRGTRDPTQYLGLKPGSKVEAGQAWQIPKQNATPATPAPEVATPQPAPTHTNPHAYLERKDVVPEAPFSPPVAEIKPPEVALKKAAEIPTDNILNTTLLKKATDNIIIPSKRVGGHTTIEDSTIQHTPNPNATQVQMEPVARQLPEAKPETTTVEEVRGGEAPSPVEVAPIEKKAPTKASIHHATKHTWINAIPSVSPDPFLAVKSMADNF